MSSVKGKYFPRYNLLLIDGKDVFCKAFRCFLERVHDLSLFEQEEGNITISTTSEIKTLISLCLKDALHSSVHEANIFIKQQKIFCNIIIYYNLKYIEDNLEIFNYIKKEFIYTQINKFVKSAKSKKINFYLDKITNAIKFENSFIETQNTTSASVRETLNIINFNLS